LACWARDLGAVVISRRIQAGGGREKPLSYYGELHVLRSQVTATIYEADVVRGQITGPWDFQVAWMESFGKTEVYQRMMTDAVYIPYTWTQG
jgi:hypothetical protein